MMLLVQRRKNIEDIGDDKSKKNILIRNVLELEKLFHIVLLTVSINFLVDNSVLKKWRLHKY